MHLEETGVILGNHALDALPGFPVGVLTEKLLHFPVLEGGQPRHRDQSVEGSNIVGTVGEYKSLRLRATGVDATPSHAQDAEKRKALGDPESLPTAVRNPKAVGSGQHATPEV